MADKKWYSMDDVELAKTALSELPDLTPSRLKKSNVLEQLKDKIIELADKKGYSAEDIRSALNSAGIQTSIKSVREIINSARKLPVRSVKKKKSSISTTENFPQ